MTIDPWDKTFPPINQADLEDDEEIDPRYNLDGVFYGETVPGQPMASELGGKEFEPVDICRFDEAGNHTFMGRACPHFDMEDEMGRTIRPGWTAQG